MAAGSGSLGRLLGLGFLFGAKDEGAVSTTEAIQEGFEGIEAAVQRVGRGTQSLQRFGNAISALNVAAISRANDALGGLADRAGLLTGGDTSLEAFGAQAGQAFRAATAGLGEYTDVVRRYRGQISGQAFNLGVDVGELTQGVAAIARTGHTLEDYGITVRDIAGLSQAGILDANALTNALTGLSEGYGLGAEGARQLIDDMTAIGTSVGSGAEAVRQLPTAIAAADAAISALPDGVEGSVDDMLRSLTTLAAGTQRTLGGTFEDAMSGAIATLGQMSEARQELSRNMSGLSTEFPEMAVGLSEAFGSVDDALNVMMTDPAAFVQEMQGVYANMGEGARRTRFTQQVLSRFPESMRFMIMAGEEGAENLRDLAGAAEESEGALSQMARSSSGSARTFGESLDLVEEVFKSRLNRMARQHYPNFERQVIQRQRAGFERLSETIGGLADQRGPLNSMQGAMGALTRTMLATRRGGVTGLTIALQDELGEAFPVLSERIGAFLPMIGEMGEGLFEAASQAGPLLLAMTQMQGRIPGLGGAMRLLFNPLTLIGGGLFLMVRHWETVGPLLQRVSGQFRDFTRTVLERVADVDWEMLGSDIVDGILSIFGFVGDTAQSREMSDTARAFAEGFRNLFDATLTIVGGMVEGIWDRVVDFVFEPENIAQRFERGAGVAGVAVGAAMFTPLRGPIIRAAMGLFSHLGGFLQSGAGAMLRGGLGGAVRKIPVIGAILGLIFDLPEIIEGFQTGGLTEGMRQVFESLLNGFLLGIPRLIEGVTGFDLGGIFDYMFEALNLGNLFRAIEGGDLGDIIFEVLFTAFNSATFGILGHVRTMFAGLFGGDVLGDSVGGIFDVLSDAWNDIGVPVMEEFMVAWDTIGVVVSELWDDVIQPMFMELQTVWDDVFMKHILPVARRVFAAVGSFARRMWRNHIKPALEKMGQLFVRILGHMQDTGIRVFRTMALIGVRAFFSITRAITTMKTNWETARDVLRAGLRMVGSEIRARLLIPFLRTRDSFTSLSENIQMGVNTMRLAFLNLARDVLTSVRTMASGLGPLGASMVRGIDAGLGPLNQMIQTQESQHEMMMRNIREEREAREGQIASEIQAQRDARQEFTDALVNRRTRLAAEERESRQREATAIAGVNRGFDAIAEGVGNVRTSLAEMTTEEGRAAISERGRLRRAEEFLGEAAPLAAQVEAAVASGAMDRAAAMSAITPLPTAAESGDSARFEAMQDRVGEMVEPVEERSLPRAGGGRRARAAPVTPQPAGDGAPERRIEAQQEEREAAAELQAVRIQEISAEAARAIARAMGGGRGRPRDAAQGRPRRGRGGAGGANTGTPSPEF